MRNVYRLVRFDWPLHFVLLFTDWLPDNVIFLRLRGWLAHWFIGSCGRDLRLGRGVTMYNPANIEIGNNVYIARGNWFSAGTKIVIDDEVIFGPQSVISSSNHTSLNGSFRYGPPVYEPIHIGRGSWVAGNCTIVAGTRIGEGCLIAANTVARGHIPAGTIFGGVPGKIIRSVEP